MMSIDEDLAPFDRARGRPLAVDLTRASEMLSVSLPTFHALVERFQLPIIQLGRRKLVRVADLEIMLARMVEDLAV